MKNKGIGCIGVLLIIVGVFIFLTIILASFNTAREETEKLQKELDGLKEEGKEKEQATENSKSDYYIFSSERSSGNKLEQIIIIPKELKNENGLFLICDDLNEKTIKEKSVSIRGLTDEKAANDLLLYDKPLADPDWRDLSDKEIDIVNSHAVLAFSKSLATPVKYHQCEIFLEGFLKGQAKTIYYGNDDYLRW